eukprot:s222_g2.t1
MWPFLNDMTAYAALPLRNLPGLWKLPAGPVDAHSVDNMDLLSQVFGRTPVEPPQEDDASEIVPVEIYRRRAFKHLTFRSEVFDLTSIEGLLRCRVDLTFLESLDVSENSLTELACIAGESLPGGQATPLRPK